MRYKVKRRMTIRQIAAARNLMVENHGRTVAAKPHSTPPPKMFVVRMFSA